MVGLAMQELMKSSFFWSFRGDGSGIPIITQKNRAEARFSENPFILSLFPWVCVCFSF